VPSLYSQSYKAGSCEPLEIQMRPLFVRNPKLPIRVDASVPLSHCCQKLLSSVQRPLHDVKKSKLPLLSRRSARRGLNENIKRRSKHGGEKKGQ